MSSRHHSSGGGTESKLEKEKTRLIQEKCQGMLNDMLRDEDNKYCVDCDAKGPRWASWNLGIFLCIRCAGIHRNLGVHISKVKSVNLDTWTPEQVMNMAQLGNSRARAIYEANLPDTTRRPQTDVALESFIRAKYEHKKYIAKEYIPTPVPKPNWDHEIEEMLKKKKKTATAGAQDIVLPPSKQFAQRVAAKAATATTKSAEDKTKQTQASDANANSSTAATNSNSTTNDLAGDLLGLTLDGATPQAAPGTASLSSDPFASPAKQSSAANDLLALDAGAAAAKIMTKDSIMSLYGKGGAGGMGMAPPQQQQQQLGGLGQLGGIGMASTGAPTSAGLNSLAGLNPFLAPAPSAMGYQAQPQAYGGGFGVPQQVPAAAQQRFMFNPTGLGSLGGLGMASAQQQISQFQQATTPMLNQYTYPSDTNPMMIPGQNPYQAMQMVPGPPAVPVGGAPFARSPQQNLFAQPATAGPLQSSPPNFLN